MTVDLAPALAQFVISEATPSTLDDTRVIHPSDSFNQEFGFQPLDNGSPRHTSGGATRGTAQCNQGSFFVALFPEDGSLPVAQSNSLQFPVFISADAGQRVIQFSLTYTDGGQDHQYQYQQLISGAETPELLEFEMPVDRIPATVDRLNWSFMMTCGGVSPDSPAIMERGWIDLTQVSQVDAATLIQERQALLTNAAAPVAVPALPPSTAFELRFRAPAP
ncbi:MAG: DUF928 domain-containing protein [Synechococcales bacterium]|nr:DUF928 domain-containing protein [Synechococcales bacterium]